MNRPANFTLLTFAFLTGCLMLVSSCSKDSFDGKKGNFTDPRDSHSYSWAKIGTQIWMSENLAYLPSVSPSDQGSDSTSISYVYIYESTYVNTAKNTDNYKTYGTLYNWTMAQSACPDGWHLPSDVEWDVMANVLGGDSLAGFSMK